MSYQYVTPKVGFALESIGASSRSRLLKTTDGGRQWVALPTHMP